MTERERLYSGIGKVAWGYVFLYFNININAVSLLPAFVGYLLFLSAIRALEGTERELSLLYIPGVLLSVWHVVDWLLSWGGVDFDGLIPVADILVGLLNLYFHFQLLTNLATLADAHQPKEAEIGARLRRCRTAQTVMLTAMVALGYLAPWIGGAWAVVSVVIAIAYVIVGIVLIKALFDLRRVFREGEEG